ncbi:MAG: COX15/CtaA family protein [Rhodocyclaceae bacterium]|jgi:cytochrome c oxidase assembly protein subunit 15|nr:COX15/CtaA family protein [Rhodocyclaceae bacterium]
MNIYRRLILIALGLTFVVVVFGAYVRLSDAGLGCPDWPGCYGQLSPHHAAEAIGQAQAAQPHGPVSLPKAWKEMIHRYLAGTLGVVILLIGAVAWTRRDEAGVSFPVALALVGVVGVQGLLGKWTVTLLLKPAIVTGHLLGGMAVLALLAWLALRSRDISRIAAGAGLGWLARGGLLVLAAQLALGGWTSTNHAALACVDFPACGGSLWPGADYGHAFHVVRELGMTADGEPLPSGALVAIHWAHRLGALVVGLVLGGLAWRLIRRRETVALGLVLAAALLLQVALGVANVLWGLPLPLAVAHNGGAALLVLVVVTVNYRLTRGAAGLSVRENHANAYA